MQGLHTFSRLLLASMAFAIAFLLTPRIWVQQERTSTAGEVPVTTLEDGGECLWCDEPPPEACDGDEADGVWLNPDAPAPEECDDSRDDSGPNA